MVVQHRLFNYKVCNSVQYVNSTVFLHLIWQVPRFKIRLYFHIKKYASRRGLHLRKIENLSLTNQQVLSYIVEFWYNCFLMCLLQPEKGPESVSALVWNDSHTRWVKILMTKFLAVQCTFFKGKGLLNNKGWIHLKALCNQVVGQTNCKQHSKWYLKLHCNIVILAEIWILAQRSHFLLSHIFSVLVIGGKFFLVKVTVNNIPST